MKKNISASLNKLIDIFDIDEVQSREGIITKSYKYIDTVFAEAKPLISGKYFQEFFIGMQLVTKDYYMFSIRENDNVKTKMLVKYNQNFYQIKKIIDEDQLVRLITSGEELDNELK